MHATVVLINGCFGVGKTTVARVLSEGLPGSAIYDPECTGPWLRRAARWLPLRGAGTDDFQDMPGWRRSAVLGTRLWHATHAGPILVPMAFDNLRYFQEVWSGIRAFAPSTTAACLTASQETLRERLRMRGTDPDEAWISRRVRECVRAHVDDSFGKRIDTDDLCVDGVANEVLRLINKARIG